MDAHTARKRGLSPKNGGIATSKRSKTDDLELVRLLHAMEKDPSPGGISWQQLESRARLCQQLFEKTSNKSLKSRVDAACHEANVAVTNLRARDTTPNPVEKIFQKKGTASHNVVTPEKVAANAKDLTKTAETAPAKIEKTKTSKKKQKSSLDVAPSTGANVAEIQKQQREQMEEAVAQMASQMKDQTSRLHSTIKGQTDGLLDTMENVTSQNVEDVAEVAAATQAQVKRNWRRTAATWTLFFTIVGAFAGTMITIQMVPKAEMKDFLSAMCAHDQANRVCGFLSEKLGTKISRITHTKQSLEEKATPNVEVVPEPVKETALPEIPEPEEKSTPNVEAVPEPVKETALPEIPEPEPEAELESNVIEISLEDAANSIAVGDIDVLRGYLEQQPSLVTEQDTNGWGLLHEAVWNGKLDMAALLLEYNCDKHMVNAAGKSALDLALIANDNNSEHPLVRLLENRAVEEAVEIDAQGEQSEIKVPVGIEAEKLREAALREFEEMQNSRASSEEPQDDANPSPDQKKLEKERIEQERIEQERMEQERMEQERMEQERMEQERMEQERMEQERTEQERTEQERTEQERTEQERMEQERMEHERMERQRKLEQVRLEQERQRKEQQQQQGQQEFSTFEGKPFSARDLRRAATRGDVRRVIAFLELRPDIINEQDLNQWTALHLAVRSGHTGVVKALLEAGAETHVRNSLGLTAMEMAVSKLGDEHEIVSLFEQYED